MVGRWLAVGALSTVLLGQAPARAHERAISHGSGRGGEAKAKALPARSIGSPTDGRLEGAKALEPSKSLKLRHPGARWGLPRLVGLLERSSRRLAQRFEGAVLLVGDLSRREGGDLAGHKSHESGRDADVAFLFVGPDGKSIVPNEFLTVTDSGQALENRQWRFDDERNWALVEAWITDPAARVEHIFVADRIRTRLLRHAREKGAYLPVLHRAALAMKQPSRGLEHDDHFHVRIGCPPGQRGVCVPQPTPSKKSEARAAPTANRPRSKAAARALVKRRKRGETSRQ